MRVSLVPAVAAVLILAGCAGRREKLVEAPPPPVVPTVAQPKPIPPGRASATLQLPALRSDGSFVTPNAGLSAEATAWHLRAALNVAALRCNDDTLIASYNGFVRAHAAVLAKAHAASMTQAGGQDAFDGEMTRLYNFFALPPVQTAFCQAAATIAAEGAVTPSGEFARFATLGLPVLDAPFQNFFREYAAYRADLARWQAGTESPRLAYDGAVLRAEGPPRRGAATIAVAAR